MEICYPGASADTPLSSPARWFLSLLPRAAELPCATSPVRFTPLRMQTGKDTPALAGAPETLSLCCNLPMKVMAGAGAKFPHNPRRSLFFLSQNVLPRRAGGGLGEGVVWWAQSVL